MKTTVQIVRRAPSVASFLLWLTLLAILPSTSTRLGAVGLSPEITPGPPTTTVQVQGDDIAGAIEQAHQLIAQGRAPRAEVRLAPNRFYYLTDTLTLNSLKDISLNGNGSTIIMKSRAATFKLNHCTNLEINALTLDHDPLPFTQGTVTGIEGKNGKIIYLKVDEGYPADAQALGNKLKMYQFNRETRAAEPGFRYTLSTAAVEQADDRTLKVTLARQANGDWDCQAVIRVGSSIWAPYGSGGDSIDIIDCENTSVSNTNIYSSFRRAIYEQGDAGGLRLVRVNIVPGPRPKGADQDRMGSIDGTACHINCVTNPFYMDRCKIIGTGDDAVDVHNFYFVVLEQTGGNQYLVSPKFDFGLRQGDTVEILDKTNLANKGAGVITQLDKKLMPERESLVRQLWRGKSPPSQPKLVYAVQMNSTSRMEPGDLITCLSRISDGTIIQNSYFKNCFRVHLKNRNSRIENNTFEYTIGPAIACGSDYGFWMESDFARNIAIKNNRFDHCGLAANFQSGVEDAIGVIWVGLVTVPSSRGFKSNYENRDIVIANNLITNSYITPIFAYNSDNLRIENNTIENPFIRKLSDQAGDVFKHRPASAIFIGRSKNAKIINNHVRITDPLSLEYTTQPVEVYANCQDVTQESNTLDHVPSRPGGLSGRP